MTSPLAEISSSEEMPSDNSFSRNPQWPAWFLDAQHKAWEEFLSTPDPTRKDESWRFSHIPALEVSGLQMAGKVESTFPYAEASQGLSTESAKIVFANGEPLFQNTSHLPEGVVVEPLTSAIHTHEALVRDYFMHQPVELGSHKFALWHKACLRQGVLIYVPANTTVSLPVEIFSWMEGREALLFPHTLLICGANSRITVLEHFCSAPDSSGFVCGINDLHLGEGACATYAALQDWNLSTRALHLNSTIVAENASATVFQANFGAHFLRSESLSRLEGRGARSLMLSLTPANGTREIDQRTLQDHAAPDTSSDLLYNNTLDDSSRTIFSGLIRVEPHAHNTDAYQKVRNLLLSDSAEANSMPGLEILADRVRCTHGATSGQINEEELFYMLARGIPASHARRMIANGFLATALERIEDPTLRKFLAQRLATHFER